MSLAVAPTYTISQYTLLKAYEFLSHRTEGQLTLASLPLSSDRLTTPANTMASTVLNVIGLFVLGAASATLSSPGAAGSLHPSVSPPEPVLVDAELPT